MKNDTGGKLPASLSRWSIDSFEGITTLSQSLATIPHKRDRPKRYLENVLYSSPIILAIALVGSIPLLLWLDEIAHTNTVASFALDFLIIGCIWTALGRSATRKKSEKSKEIM